MDFYDAYACPDRRTVQSKHNTRGGRPERTARHDRHFGDFECRHCHAPVAAQAARSGVHNRNHCPYCLWSRHVDLHVAGDRLAACKGLMAPVGLTLKQVHKKYAARQAGELMLVHQCTACGALSINRVAADDLPAVLWEVFEASVQLSPEARAAAEADGIALLGAQEAALARGRVFGYGATEETHSVKDLTPIPLRLE